jgi:hypothetical protein
MKKKPAKTLRVCSECTERKKMLFDAHNRALKAEDSLKTELLANEFLREELEILRADVRDYKAACSQKQEQIDGAKTEIENLQIKYDGAREVYQRQDVEIFQLKADLALWQRIWTQDTRYAAEQARNQAQIIAALVQGNKSLRTELDRWERFRVTSPLLAQK